MPVGASKKSKNSTAGETRVRFGDVKWSDDQSVAAFVQQAAADKDQYMRAWEARANQAIAWYRGYQNLFWDFDARSLATVSNPRKRVRLTLNKIKPQVDQWMAFVTSEPIVPDASPATEDHDDEERARLSTHICRYYSDKLDADWLDEQVVRWSGVTGAGYLAAVWNPDAGDVVDGAKMLQMEPDEYRKVYGESPEVRVGDLEFEVVPSTSVFWGPYGCEFEDADWVLVRSERSRSYVEERYDVDASQLASGNENRTIWRQSDVTASGVSARNSDNGECLTVDTLWVKRSNASPHGRLAVYCGDVALNRKGNAKLENPYEDGSIPIFRLACDPIPDDPLGIGQVENLIGPQANYNRNASQQVENRETMAQPGFMAQQGSIPNADLWTGEAGNIKFYNGVAPTPVQGMAMPNVVLAQQSRDVETMQDLTGVHDVSQSKVPTGAKSGRAVLALQEKDEARTAMFRRRRRRFWERVWRCALKILKQFASEERMIKILSQDNRWEILRWTGADLVGYHSGPGVDYYDIRIRTDGLPISRIARSELVTMFINSQALKPGERPRDADIMFRMLGIDDISATVDPTRADKMKAREENERLAAGEDVPVMPSDDDAVHLAEHNHATKTPWFWQTQGLDQDSVWRHIEKHKMAVAIKALEPQLYVQRAMMAMGLIPPGAPNPGDSAAPPGASGGSSGGSQKLISAPGGQGAPPPQIPSPDMGA